jgi:AcrR family transcriptional regulator
MPRVAGQIDIAKNEAILDAAVEVLSERGVSGPIEEIARRASVSKQTIYNHYGSKAELVRALCERRVAELTAPLESPDAFEHPDEALAQFARVLLGAVLEPGRFNIMRMAMLGATEMPEIGQAMFEAGPRASRRKLAEFLARETEAGRLNTPDPRQAAEFFAGMVIGSFQMAALLGVDPAVDEARAEVIAREAAARFMRAYAP